MLNASHKMRCARSAWKVMGFSVIRFWNNDVLTNTDGVLESIMSELNLRGAPFSATTLPRRTGAERTKTQSRPRVMAARSSVPSPPPTKSACADGVGQGQGEGAPASKNSPVPHLHPIRVYFEDTDAGGMVYYANYLKFAERARTEMLRSAGFNHAAMVAQDGLMLVVRRLHRRVSPFGAAGRRTCGRNPGFGSGRCFNSA